MPLPRCFSWRWAGESTVTGAERGGDRSARAVQSFRQPERPRKPRPGPLPRRNPRRGRRLRQWQVGAAAQYRRPAQTQRGQRTGVRPGPAQPLGTGALPGRTALRCAVPEGRAVFLADGHRERRPAADRTRRPQSARCRTPGGGQAGPGRPAAVGRQQIPGLARALALDPDILFLDEPTAGLDPIGAAAFDQLILTLRDALGLSVFLVTHDLDTLYTITDRVAVLAQKHVLVADAIDRVAETDDPWIHEYFHGPRGRAAFDAVTPHKEG